MESLFFLAGSEISEGRTQSLQLTVVVKEGEDRSSSISHRGLDLARPVLLGTDVGVGLKICFTWSDTFKMSGLGHFSITQLILRELENNLSVALKASLFILK